MRYDIIALESWNRWRIKGPEERHQAGIREKGNNMLSLSEVFDPLISETRDARVPNGTNVREFDAVIFQDYSGG